MSQKEMLQSQVLEEVIRERTNYYKIREKMFDFWIMVSPDFLDTQSMITQIHASKFYEQKRNQICDKLGNEFYSVFLSPDEDFMRWLKLRIGYFENIKEPYVYNEQDFVSDGVFGFLETCIDPMLLKSNKYHLHPDIQALKLKTSLEMVYKVQNDTNK
jgi:hypothetical protein